MALIKTKEEIEIMREGGRRLSEVLEEVARAIVSGVTTSYLDQLAEKLIRDRGDIPSFKNYRPEGAQRAFPASLCVSVNDEIVHGIPGDRVIDEGDIVGIDLGITHKGLITDMAITVPVGKISESDKVLLKATRVALMKGVAAMIPGNTVGDISAAIEESARHTSFKLVEELGGHGVGYAVHEEPHVPNTGNKGEGEELRVGMVLAIEPMLNKGAKSIRLAPDKFTFVTSDGARSAHFELSVAVGEHGPDILTPPIALKL